MTVKQGKTGAWSVEIDRKGIPRIRKGNFASKSEAELFEREYLTKHSARQNMSTDKRTLKELAELWNRYHGINLSDGERRKTCLIDMATHLKNPQASLLSAESFVEYRYKRLKEGLNEKTFNNHHGYLSSMYNKLRKLKVIDYENPIADVDFIKVQERELSYLFLEQIPVLLDTIKDHCQNESTWFVAQICLRTGARWGEAENLKFKQLRDNRITYVFTKSKKTRAVPVDPEFFKSLLEFAKYKDPEDRVFSNCIGSFRRAILRSKIKLPRGQCSHILRHTFASHFIMKGGNIVYLQKILGHADIKMTMRYAHLAPEHLSDAIKLNPLS